MKAATLIEKLNKAVPECNAVDTEEWNGNKGGIWFKGSEDITEDDIRIFDPWISSEEQGASYSIHPAVFKLVTENGFYFEPWDNGTMMAYFI
tara:strand:+ start:425 stop:700 length:276 start_codon:yes stop_codon:yes gene_type:complete